MLFVYFQLRVDAGHNRGEVIEQQTLCFCYFWHRGQICVGLICPIGGVVCRLPSKKKSVIILLRLSLSCFCYLSAALTMLIESIGQGSHGAFCKQTCLFLPDAAVYCPMSQVHKAARGVTVVKWFSWLRLGFPVWYLGTDYELCFLPKYGSAQL